MITLNQAIQLATEAHNGQYRTPIKVFPNNEHTLANNEITKLQQNNGSDFSICKEDGEYTMNIHLELLLAKPYITHPLAVMNAMHTEEEKIVAVLHDVFENCPGYALGRVMDNSEFYIRNRNNIEKHVISENIYTALMLLSKDRHTPYNDYITALSQNKLAIKVKIADMMHNMSETTSNRQKQKYLQALPILLKGL